MANIKLIVGLGNPGPSYLGTRHNAGQEFVEQLAQHYAISLSENKKFFGLYGSGTIANQTVHLLVPTTFMNRSGQSVGAVAGFYKIVADEILVAHDELDFDAGLVRLKQGGSHGGHNGLRDIITALGNNKDFYRLRLGIGRPDSKQQVVDYVLKKAPLAEREKLQQCSDKALNQLDNILHGQWQKAMNELHSFKA